MPLLPNRYRGRLIVVEGIDGSGKSTQLSLLSQWLRSQRVAVAFSEWNSSPLVRETTRRGKKEEMFHAGDVQPDSRHRFRRPAGTLHRSGC